MQEYFLEIKDPRHEGYVKHKLADVLTIVMCSVMCRMKRVIISHHWKQMRKNF